MGGRVAGYLHILREMPRNDPFLVADLKIKLATNAISTLYNRNLLEKVGKGGPQKRMIVWKLSARAKRFLEDE